MTLIWSSAQPCRTCPCEKGCTQGLQGLQLSVRRIRKFRLHLPTVGPNDSVVSAGITIPRQNVEIGTRRSTEQSCDIPQAASGYSVSFRKTGNIGVFYAASHLHRIDRINCRPYTSRLQLISHRIYFINKDTSTWRKREYVSARFKERYIRGRLFNKYTIQRNDIKYYGINLWRIGNNVFFLS